MHLALGTWSYSSKARTTACSPHQVGSGEKKGNKTKGMEYYLASQSKVPQDATSKVGVHVAAPVVGPDAVL